VINMLLRIFTAFVIVVSLAASAQAANEELVLRLKQLGKAVDDVAINISKAETDADAELLANVTRQAFANGLSGERPEIVLEGSRGRCSVVITTPGWRLWSQAENGQIVDHGATIN
jgi:hypothetical protein